MEEIMGNTQSPIELDFITARNVDLWLRGQYDEATKVEILKLMRENPQEVIDAFYTHLSFGTGGLRGIMGVGCNRMNVYTVRAATQGLANYINKQSQPSSMHSVVIGYDSRHNSRSFAEESAKVMAGNGIKVLIFQELRPSPLISFACRFKGCSAAIMITASHNPPEYNGYKVYWNDGGQVLPPHDKLIVHEVEQITDLSMVKMVETLSHPLIQWIWDEIDVVYLRESSALQHYPDINQADGKTLKIVYTSLHGTGITLIPKELANWGFSNVVYVKQQIIPDGSFPAVASPNPENKIALEMGIQVLENTRADLLIANDPDADRVGIAVSHRGQTQLLNGNQIACLCLNHVCKALTLQKKMPPKAAFIKSIGTTELFQAICDAYGKPCFNVLPGFKYYGEKIQQWENDANGYQYIFGGEESCGYLLGTLTHDKDAILSSALICEIALHAKRQGKTLVDFMEDLYWKHGLYFESLLSVEFDESKDGKEQMAAAMVKLREKAPKMFLGIEVVAIEDYLNSSKTYLQTGKKELLTLPKSDVLVFWLADKSKLMIRLSGTEPKLKLYCGVFKKTFTSVSEAWKNCQNKAEQLLQELLSTIKTKTSI
jgi:phosphomannomutase